MGATPLLTSVDGVITPSESAFLPLPDDGLIRGDGVFEVLRLYDGHPFEFEGHLDRMQLSAAAIALKVDRETLRAEAGALIARLGAANVLVRLIVTRGGRRLVSSEPLPAYPPASSLATVTYSPTVILNGVKSLSYAANMQANRLAREKGAEEALLVTPDGKVLEGPTSALFWVSEGRLRSTHPDEGVLASITAKVIIDRLEVELGLFPVEDVLNASEVFVSSTTREAQPVGSIDGKKLSTHPAPWTAAAATAVEKALAEAQE